MYSLHHISTAHVEIGCKLADMEEPKDVYDLIEAHMKEQLEAWSPTKFGHSFDEVKKIFRFDMKPEGELSFSAVLLRCVKHALICFDDVCCSVMKKMTTTTNLIQQSNLVFGYFFLH